MSNLPEDIYDGSPHFYIFQTPLMDWRPLQGELCHKAVVENGWVDDQNMTNESTFTDPELLNSTSAHDEMRDAGDKE